MRRKWDAGVSDESESWEIKDEKQKQRRGSEDEEREYPRCTGLMIS